MDYSNTVENYDALVRRANKMVLEYNRYPLMPEGDYSIDFIQNVFNFNPLFVLDDLKRSLLNMLFNVTQYKYSEEQLQPIIDETYTKQELWHKERILKILIENYRADAQHFRFRHWSYMMLRPEETVIFYYAFSIFYIARELKNGSALLFARKALSAIDLLYCEKGTNPIDGIKKAGKMLSLSEFQEDKSVYYHLLDMIDSEIEQIPDEDVKQELHEIKSTSPNTTNNGGCYIATCVYGSYNCPEVWVLRRYRDYFLLKTVLGRLFVNTYYAVSPHIVKLFGNSNTFKQTCKSLLDRFVNKLRNNGYDDYPYEDPLKSNFSNEQ